MKHDQFYREVLRVDEVLEALSEEWHKKLRYYYLLNNIDRIPKPEEQVLFYVARKKHGKNQLHLWGE